MAKSSKRITLGTYTERGLHDSFHEGEYATDGGLAAAIEDAERAARFWGPHNADELGVCVAVFGIGLHSPTRIIKRFPWGQRSGGGMTAYERAERSFDAY